MKKSHSNCKNKNTCMGAKNLKYKVCKSWENKNNILLVSGDLYIKKLEDNQDANVEMIKELLELDKFKIVGSNEDFIWRYDHRLLMEYNFKNEVIGKDITISVRLK